MRTPEAFVVRCGHGKYGRRRHQPHQGDAAGYDIKSYTLNETAKFIEVKTTSGDESTPFVISSNELDFAKKNKDFYYIYRIFNYSILKNFCSFYVVSGDPETAFNLVPTEYKAFRT